MHNTESANRITHAVVDVEAPTPEDACERCGWLIGNCFVQPRPGTRT